MGKGVTTSAGVGGEAQSRGAKLGPGERRQLLVRSDVEEMKVTGPVTPSASPFGSLTVCGELRAKHARPRATFARRRGKGGESHAGGESLGRRKHQNRVGVVTIHDRVVVAVVDGFGRHLFHASCLVPTAGALPGLAAPRKAEGFAGRVVPSISSGAPSPPEAGLSICLAIVAATPFLSPSLCILHSFATLHSPAVSPESTHCEAVRISAVEAGDQGASLRSASAVQLR